MQWATYFLEGGYLLWGARYFTRSSMDIKGKAKKVFLLFLVCGMLSPKEIYPTDKSTEKGCVKKEAHYNGRYIKGTFCKSLSLTGMVKTGRSLLTRHQFL